MFSLLLQEIKSWRWSWLKGKVKHTPNTVVPFKEQLTTKIRLHLRPSHHLSHLITYVTSPSFSFPPSLPSSSPSLSPPPLLPPFHPPPFLPSIPPSPSLPPFPYHSCWGLVPQGVWGWQCQGGCGSGHSHWLSVCGGLSNKTASEKGEGRDQMSMGSQEAKNVILSILHILISHKVGLMQYVLMCGGTTYCVYQLAWYVECTRSCWQCILQFSTTETTIVCYFASNWKAMNGCTQLNHFPIILCNNCAAEDWYMGISCGAGHLGLASSERCGLLIVHVN